MQAAHWKCKSETEFEAVSIGRESAAILVLRSALLTFSSPVFEVG